MKSLDPARRWVTKLSSAGLVYFHFGQEIVATLLGAAVTDPLVGKVYDKARLASILIHTLSVILSKINKL